MQTEIIIALAIIGLVASIYALYVKRKKQNNKNYHAVCDINSKISCTTALTSKYSTILILPNSMFGMLFYPLVIMLALQELTAIIALLATISVGVSFYLAYISWFKLKVMCPVCTVIYIVNIALLITTLI